MKLPHTPDALLRLAEDLREFTVERVADRIGPRAVAALGREDPLPAAYAATGPDPLALLIRLFLLGDELTPAHIHVALPRSANQAQQWGILSGGRAAVDLRPTTIGARDVWLASDPGEIVTGDSLPANHVLGLGGASATLADITIRTPVERALDLGTGSGIQTLGLLDHAREVLATDISARALEFAEFNVALNTTMDRLTAALGSGASNAAEESRGAGGGVEFREGSFFDPVDGDFDLIVSNPPFVISPRGASLAEYTYRDGGQEGDEVMQHLIATLPRFLRPGGVAQLLANWEVHGDAPWQERVGAWVRATGLDAWVIQREFLDPAHYVDTWLRDGGLTLDRDREGYRRAYRDWLADLDSRGVSGIGFGYLVLRKPRTVAAGAGAPVGTQAADGGPWVRMEEITGTIARGLGETIGRTLEMVEELARTSDAQLLTWHAQVPGDVTEERYYRPGASDPNVILLRQGGAFARTVQVDTLVAAAVGACDGELSLGQICAALAELVEATAEAVASDVLPTLRGLLTDGIIVRSGPARATLNR